MLKFLKHFDEVYYNKLDKRTDSFRKIFELLEEKNKDYYLIIETGCSRIKDNYIGDGMSTVLFDDFVNFYDGKVISVDISEKSCKVARSLVSNKTKVICENSVKFLWQLTVYNEIDLIYLDSFDIKFNSPHPSAFHHIKEFCAIMPNLSRGTIVVVDDNTEKSGKGRYIAEFMEDVGIKKVIDDYQIAWIL
jgi:hypothetical protein